MILLFLKKEKESQKKKKKGGEWLEWPNGQTNLFSYTLMDAKIYFVFFFLFFENLLLPLQPLHQFVEKAQIAYTLSAHFLIWTYLQASERMILSTGWRLAKEMMEYFPMNNSDKFSEEFFDTSKLFDLPEKKLLDGRM